MLLLFIENNWPLTKVDFADNRKLSGPRCALAFSVISFELVKIRLTVLPFLPTSFAKLLLKPTSA